MIIVLLALPIPKIKLSIARATSSCGKCFIFLSCLMKYRAQSTQTNKKYSTLPKIILTIDSNHQSFCTNSNCAPDISAPNLFETQRF